MIFPIWMAIAFLHPFPGVILAVFAACASSLAGILHPGLGYAPCPTAVLPGYWSNPGVVLLQSPGSWPRPGKPHGAPVPPHARISPCCFFIPHLLCFPGPDALFSAADAAGCWEDNGAAKGTGSPWRCWIFLSWAVFPPPALNQE